MKITPDGQWTRFEGERWELEDEFPHLTPVLAADDEDDRPATPGDWCTIDIYSGPSQDLGDPLLFDLGDLE